MPAIVGDADVQAKRLGDVAAAFFVEAKRDGIGQQRLGGPQIDLELVGRAHAWDRLEPFRRRALDFLGVGVGILGLGGKGRSY